MTRRNAHTAPLKPAVFQILLAITAGPRHGLGIADEIDAITGHAVRIGPGTLYRSLKQMTAAGLIREIRAEPGADPRRRFYAITSQGRLVLEADAVRYDRLARLARKRGVLPAQAQS